MLGFDSYNLIIAASLILIISFYFGLFAKKTNVPSVLLLIMLGIGLKFVLDSMGGQEINFLPVLKVLGTVGLIMIVLEAALELELKPEKTVPIFKAFAIALIGLFVSMIAAAYILYYFIDGMSMFHALLYATPLSILSSAIIIPSVLALREDKKEFHIYESTFSDILGIIVFFYLEGCLHEGGPGIGGYSLSIFITIFASVIVSYILILIFQNIKSHTKLFLLIATLLLLFALGKKLHLSSLIIILIFGLMISNMRLFFVGPMKKLLKYKKAIHIYEGLHIVTMETAFVVRTFFFVIFGLTISLAALFDLQVAIISILIIVSIYVIRFIMLRLFIGGDILPQLFIAPRGLITVLLFYEIPTGLVPGFDKGILLFIIIVTSLIMTAAMIYDKNRSSSAVKKASELSVGYEKWKAPTLDS
jgi:NhaP-type Na+/H+ or K+/H+ antiporter